MSKPPSGRRNLGWGPQGSYRVRTDSYPIGDCRCTRLISSPSQLSTYEHAVSETRLLAFGWKRGTPTRANVFFILLLSLFPSSVSRAQESAGAHPEGMQSVSNEQAAPVSQAVPPAEGRRIEEEHPRLFWIVPTYTVTSSKLASPLTPREKWRLFLKDESDPFTFGWVAFEAGLAQANDSFSGYGQGAAGYGKRLGAGLADEWASGFFGTFLFASVLHQDPRYYRVGAGPFKNRLGHALIRPVLTHKDSAGRAFNWSGILGSIAASGLSNVYYPEGDRGAGPTFSRVALRIPFSMIEELFDEFGPDLEKKILGKK